MVVQPCPCKLVLDDLAQVSLYFVNAHTQHSAQVSLHQETDYHLLATIENSLLGSGPCLAQVALCSLKQNSDRALDSPGRMKHPNLTKRFALSSVGFLTSKMPTPASLLSSLRQGALLSVRKKMAARKHREIHDVEQTKKISPFITREATCGQHVCELVFGVNMFDLDFWDHIDSVKQPIKCNSVGSRHVSHRRTSAFDHFDHCFIVFKKVKLGFEVRRFCACDNVVHLGQVINFSVAVYLRFGVGVGVCAFEFHCAIDFPMPEY